MRCTVEERAYTPMGGKIVAASRFVEVDGELDLAIHRQAGSVSSSEPFGSPPIASGVAPEVLGVEHRYRHNPRPMMRTNGTMTAEVGST